LVDRFLTDEQWERIAPHTAGKPVPGPPEAAVPEPRPRCPRSTETFGGSAIQGED
jgi:hypothetical protein